MSWNDFYLRRDVLDAALRQARHNPRAALDLRLIPRATEVFADEAELLLALRHRWDLILDGHLGAELGTEPAASNGAGDRTDAVTRAWRTARRCNPVLREVLDAGAERHPGLLDRAALTEQRTLARAAGLAGPADSADEAAAVGAALLALLRVSPSARSRCPVRRREPVRQLLRRLVPSA